MKNKKTLISISLIVVLLSAFAVVYAGDPNPGSGAVNFTVMNKDSVNDATVVAQYVNMNGGVDAVVNDTIAPLSSAGFPIGQSGLPDGWAGSVIVSANSDVAAFAQIRWSGGAYGDGKTAGAYNSFAAGANTLYFPSLKALDGNQFSILSIQSAEGASESETITFDIDFYNRDGTSAGSLTSETVYKGAQKSYDLLDDITLPDNWNGSAVVTSASPLAGVATTHWQTYSTAYSALTGGGTTAYVPEARRRLTNGGAWDQFAGIVVQNLDTSTDAQVTVEWYNRSGTLLHSFNDTIPANSSHGYNTRFGADIPDNTQFGADIGTRWNGSVIIESTNGRDVVAVTNLQWTDDSAIGAAGTSFTSEDVGTERVLIPATFRLGSGGNWKQFTGLIVQNIGTSSCSNFNVDWFDRAGANLLSYQDTLDTGISHGYNTRYGADIPAGSTAADLGGEFRGSVVIDAPGCELIAIHNTVWPDQTDSTTYQGVAD